MKTELHVPSDLRFLNVAEHWLLGTVKAEIGAQRDWDQQSQRIRLALVEAYSNVVRHAHQDQPHLPIVLHLELSQQELALEIWDHGAGYNVEAYFAPDPTTLQEHGYGWLILNRLMDRVDYQLHINGRNCLRLETSLV
jgi:serine/threonine-protein kinase RsbW